MAKAEFKALAERVKRDLDQRLRLGDSDLEIPSEARLLLDPEEDGAFLATASVSLFRREINAREIAA